uniref:GRIP domain-containing protein n=1 Tax=Glossina morsitans morsitans TaxID=37546 RepID=A0A1B0FD33_GLOMM
MFASLKNKIKEETGSDVISTTSSGGANNFTPTPPHPPHHRLVNHSNNNKFLQADNRRFPSTISVNSNDDQQVKNDQLSLLRVQCQDLQNRLHSLQDEKSRIEKTNEILLESVKVAQTQKDLYCEEQEKIQNIQQNEIEKLRSLLAFREQEAVDRLSGLRQSQQQVENLTSELERLKHLELEVEDLKHFRHASQLDKNNLTTTMAAMKEENEHLKMRLQIVQQSRVDSLNALSTDEKLLALVQERKLLEQHLEEAHLQLSDIKSSWSGQNLALETQVSRLSKQVAEETTEKRKIQKIRDDLGERVKQLEFDLISMKDEVQQRDVKIKLLEEEIDELNSTLKECREENEQQILFERNKSENLQKENLQLKCKLESNEERFNDFAADSSNAAQSLRQQIEELQCSLNQEKDEKLTALLKNAEISQNLDILRKELKSEQDETNELQEKNKQLESELKTINVERQTNKENLEELRSIMHKNENKLREIDDLQRETVEKNKTIKILNQRLLDLKKTLQKEFCSVKTSEGNCNCGYRMHANDNGVVMDEVNFKYLKHVIVKFLTSREVEARHLLRAVATLLKLTKEEEKLLHDTLTWKMSWFGSKPDHGSGQHAFSIPPS